MPETATLAETNTGTDDNRMVSPLKVRTTYHTYSTGDIVQRPNYLTVAANMLLCDGSEVSRTTYADLFAIVGTRYGVGDGATTFNLPDLRQEVEPLSTESFSNLSPSLTGTPTDVCLDSNTGDIFVSVDSSSQVLRYINATSTWVDQLLPGGSGAITGITFMEDTNQVWVTRGTQVWYRTPVASPTGSWTQDATAPSITYAGIIASNDSDQDIYAFSSTSIRKRTGSTGTWGTVSGPGGTYTSMALNSRTGDVFVGTSTGVIYFGAYGIQTFTLHRPGTGNILGGMAVHDIQNDLYLSEDSGSVYVAEGYGGQYNDLIGATILTRGIDVDQRNGTLALGRTTDVQRRSGTSTASYIVI